MNKSFIKWLGLIMLFSVFLVACSSNNEKAGATNSDDPNNSAVLSAMDVASKYKMEELHAAIPAEGQMTPERIKAKEDALRPLTTEHFLNVQTGSRTFARAPRIAFIKQTEVDFVDVMFEDKSVTDKIIEVTYNGTFTMGEEKLGLEGTITLLNEDNAWKVNKDVYNSEDLLSIIDAERGK